MVHDAVRARVGAAVDVDATFDTNDVDALDTGFASTTPAVVVAAGASLLASDVARSSSGGDARGVTLLLTPRQAKALASAADPRGR